MEACGQSNTKVDGKKLRLAEAISAGRLYQTKMILENKPNLNYVDGQGLSPLKRAFMIEEEKRRTRIAMVKLLLQHNADVNLRDNQGQHALGLACRMNKLDLVKLLFEKCLQDVDLTSQDLEGNTPLMYAVENNNVDMVRLLVNAMRKFSLSVDLRNCEDKTPYYKAVEMGHEECARVLLNYGKASQSIEVNPFVDLAGTNQADGKDRVRVSSAPASLGTIVRGKHGVNKRRRVIKDVDGGGKILSKKTRGIRLRKFRIVHSEVSQKRHNPNENDLKSRTPEAGKCVESFDARATRKKTRQYCLDGNVNAILVENSARKKSEYDGKHGTDPKEKNFKKFPEKTNSASNRVENFLGLILREPGSDVSRRSKTPTLCTSTNPFSRSISPPSKTQERRKRIVPAINNFLESRDAQKKDVNGELGIVRHARSSTTSTTEDTSVKVDSNYYTYLEWKASLDASPNTLRNLLALRAEQQSEISSYRKGHTLPKYEHRTEELVENRGPDAAMPVPQRSAKSEAVRKISAVAKTIGLSMYLSNKVGC